MLAIAFRSGMSARSDMQGAMDAGVPLGVVAGLLTTAQLCIALPRYLDSGRAVFLDSGAFNELTTGSDLNWARIVGCYQMLAEMTDQRQNLFVVAPDKVGDQDESLARLRLWAPAMRRLIGAGVRVIVPLQQGELSAAALLDEVAIILGSRQFVAGIPSNKAALSLEECATLKHHAFHVLGRVHADAAQEARLAALRQASPAATITADANWLRSRLADVRRGVERERAQARSQRCGGQREVLATLDHPRVAAICRAIQQDLTWGGCHGAR